MDGRCPTRDEITGDSELYLCQAFHPQTKGVCPLKRVHAVLFALIALGLLAFLSWCYWPEPLKAPRAVQPRPAPAPAAKTTVTLYFANRAYVESGDESLPHLVAEKRHLDLAGARLAAEAVRALQAGPKSSRAAGVIRADLRILGVKVERGVAYVDLARVNLSGGSLEEMLMIQGVVKTLTGLAGIEAVRFLVDGKPTDTLMGHLAVDEPLTPADLSLQVAP